MSVIWSRYRYKTIMQVVAREVEEMEHQPSGFALLDLILRCQNRGFTEEELAEFINNPPRDFLR